MVSPRITACIFFILFSAVVMLGTSSLAFDPKSRKNRYYALLCGIFMFFLLCLVFLSVNTVVVKSLFLTKINNIYPIDFIAKVMLVVFLLLVLLFKRIKKNQILRIPDTITFTRGYNLSNKRRINYVFYATFLFLMGSHLNLLQLFFDLERAVDIIGFSVLLVFTASALMLVTFCVKSRLVQDIYLGVNLSFLSFYSIVRFQSSALSNNIWLILILCMVLSIFSETKSTLLAMAITSVLSLGFTWASTIGSIITVNWKNALAALLLYLFTMGIIILIRQFFFQHIQRNNDQIHFQQILHHLSFDSALVHQDNIRDVIRTGLADIGEFYNFSYGNFNLFSPGQRNWQSLYWFDSQFASNDANLDQMEAYIEKNVRLPFLASQKSSLEKGEIILLANTKTLRAMEKFTDTSVVAVELPSKFHYLLVLPVIVDNTLEGMVSFGLARHPADKTTSAFYRRRQDLRNIESIRLISNTLSGALGRVIALEELEKLAFYDYLTGLYNKAGFFKKTESLFLSLRQNTRLLGLAFIDLDDFREINNAIGHEAGDIIIQVVARLLVSTAGSGAVIARFGGDSFLLCCPKIDTREHFESWVKGIIEIFNQPIQINNQSFQVGVTCGIAFAPNDGANLDGLVKNAELAMYDAKQNKKKAFLVCTREMKDEVAEKRWMTDSLYKAIVQDELEVFYQPQIDSSNGRLVGIEALVRWQHPTQGFLLPDIFLPYAESGGLIRILDKWVLNKACAQNHQWQTEGRQALPVAVNISSQLFYEGNFAGLVAKTLEQTGLAARYLEIELKEECIMANPTEALAIIERLKSQAQTADVGIVIDDFGSKRSVLQILSRLALSKIKVDRVFTFGVITDRHDRAIIEMIQALACSNKASLVAVGAETAEQVQTLAELGCPLVQGFAFYPAMDTDGLKLLLSETLRGGT